MDSIEKLDIIKMGSLNAAKMLKVADSLGTVEVGKMADMILLDKNPIEAIKNTLFISRVFKNGVLQKRLEP